jgi:hypothetical protein
MSPLLEILARGLLMGVAGAALMDVWAFVLRRGFSVPTLNYALLGRWILHMPRGKFVHERIAAAPSVRGERPLGWLAHYAIGVVFAVALLLVWGLEWAQAPTLLPALAVGIGTIWAPWFVMQPAMGAGIAGSRTPNPRASRLRNLGTHAVYGAGLYFAASAMAALA